MRGFYAKDFGTAQAIRDRIEEAGLVVSDVREVDLLTEGMSLVPRKAVLVEVLESDFEAAADVIQEREPQLLEWTEDLSNLSLGFRRRDKEPVHQPPRPPAGRRQEWEADPAAWSDDLFEGDDGLVEAVLAWLEASSAPTAPQMGRALERAIREDRQELIWPLCRLLKPVVEDLYARYRNHQSHGLLDIVLLDAMREHAPGSAEMIESLVALSWDASATARRNFCLAAGQLSSETFLPALVGLLDDPEEEVRYEALGALYGMVHQDMGYDSQAPVGERAIAVARWKEWLAKRRGGAA